MKRGRSLLIWTLAALIALPVITVFLAWFSPDPELWAHLRDTLLPEMLLNSVLLCLWVAAGCLLLGVSLAWLVSRYAFPGRDWLQWALVLPFAIPPYVLAFVYLGLFNYAGPLQSWLHSQFALPGVDIRESRLVLAGIFSLVFFPYVYLPARMAFMTQAASYDEAAASFGYGRLRRLRHITLPLARPALAAGVLLAVMETLADFGVVAIFNYTTFTTAIYSAWEDYRSLQSAAQIASLLVLFCLLLMLGERFQRHRHSLSARSSQALPRQRLSGIRGWLASACVAVVLGLAFILPVGQMLVWALTHPAGAGVADTLAWSLNSLRLACMAALLTVCVAVLLVLGGQNGSKKGLLRYSAALASSGYALPGSVMAVGLMIGLDALIPGLAFGSVGVLLYAYVSRFTAVSLGPLEQAAAHYNPHWDEAARTLGAGLWQRLAALRLPLMLPALASGFLLVMLDVLKELPATYLLRPYGWDTLAVRIYQLTSEGRYQEAAQPALLLILCTLLLFGLSALVRAKASLRRFSRQPQCAPAATRPATQHRGHVR
ncbi:iron ABC transporter permease [Granulosicoccaceae sp. 1_MG-2023]|nr:iron ABC transporter permease [Granulosicoccaceae sp. 1_MG-2023]